MVINAQMTSYIEICFHIILEKYRYFAYIACNIRLKPINKCTKSTKLLNSRGNDDSDTFPDG